MAKTDASSASRRSLLWDTYFEKRKDEGKCVTCKKVLQCKGGNTVGLSRHLKSAHKKEWAEYEAVVARRDEEKLKRNLSIGKSMPPPKRRKEDFFKNHEGEDVVASDKFHKSLVKHIAASHASFGQFGMKSFQRVVSSLNPRVKVKHPTTLSRMVSGEAKHVRKELAAILKAVKPDLVSLAFTTDLWTSRASDSFISLTLTFIDKDWFLHNWVPFVRLFAFNKYKQHFQLKSQAFP